MTKCLSCGKCTPYCPSSALSGLDPHELMVSGEGDVSECIQCGNCSRICRRTDPFAVIRIMLADGNIPAEPVTSLSNECDIAVFPGCTVRKRIPELMESTMEAISKLGYNGGTIEGEACCLRPPVYSSLTGAERRARIMRMLAPANGKRIVTPCPECAEELGEGSEHILELLLENIDKLPKSKDSLKVTVFTGCALSSRKKDIEKLITAMNLEISMISTGCCGRDSGNRELMEDRLRECDGSSYAVTFCPRCTLNYSQEIPTLHITQAVSDLFHGGIIHADPYVCPYGGRKLAADMTRW